MTSFDTGPHLFQLGPVQEDVAPNFTDGLVPGGDIPASGGLPAFSFRQSSVSPIPVLVAAPHGGRSYPPALSAQMRNPGPCGLRLEDRYADLLALRLAQATGAELLIAHAPRAMIDLNRSLDDMDWTMIEPPARDATNARPESRRMRGGLGLIPRRLAGLDEIWKAPLPAAELELRMQGIHRPYHDRLQAILATLRRRWGAALLIDLHSMPPLAPGAANRTPAQVVLGDRFGASCVGTIAAAAFDEFAMQGLHAAHNRPYAGGYVLERHCNPSNGLHGLQLELCRSLYLDAQLVEPGHGFDATLAMLIRLVRRLADEVAATARGGVSALAAE
ncbi:MAG: N-formylglutamate amidohydrolase [Novosphingobium sp.]